MLLNLDCMISPLLIQVFIDLNVFLYFSLFLFIHFWESKWQFEEQEELTVLETSLHKKRHGKGII